MDTQTDNSLSAPTSAGPFGTHTDLDKSLSAAERTAKAKVTAEANAAERAARRAEGQDILSRVVKGAHETIDRLAETAAPHVHKLEETVGDANLNMRLRAGQARDVSDEWADTLRQTVREHPLAALATAVAIGMIVARATR